MSDDAGNEEGQTEKSIEKLLQEFLLKHQKILDNVAKDDKTIQSLNIDVNRLIAENSMLDSAVNDLSKKLTDTRNVNQQIQNRLEKIEKKITGKEEILERLKVIKSMIDIAAFTIFAVVAALLLAVFVFTIIETDPTGQLLAGGIAFAFFIVSTFIFWRWYQKLLAAVQLLQTQILPTENNAESSTISS